MLLIAVAEIHKLATGCQLSVVDSVALANYSYPVVELQ